MENQYAHPKYLDQLGYSEAAKQRAEVAVAEYVDFCRRTQAQEPEDIDFSFVEVVVKCCAASGSALAAVRGDTNSYMWFDDDFEAPGRIEPVGDDAWGRRRYEAAHFLKGIESPIVRELVVEVVGTALLLQISNELHPRNPLDFYLLAQAFVHVFSAPKVISIWIATSAQAGD